MDMKTGMAGLLLAVFACAAAPSPADARQGTSNPNHWAPTVPTKRTTTDGRPLASSLPPRGGSQRVQPKTITFSELPRHVGERLEITTIYGDRHAGQLESVSGKTMRLRRSAGIGYAVTNFDQEKIRLIRDMD